MSVADAMDKAFSPDVRALVDEAGVVVGVWPITPAGRAYVLKQRNALLGRAYDYAFKYAVGLTIESVDEA